MANVFRRLLADAIRRNGGYSRGYHDRFAVSYEVGLYYIDLSLSHLERLARKEHNAAEWGAPPAIEWDENRVFESIQWQMCEGLNDDDGNRTLSPETAARCGFAYNTPTGLKYYSRIVPGKDFAYHPAKVAGWKIVNPYCAPFFEVTFGLYGRGGKHLCVTEFEGKSLDNISADDLADAIENDDSGDYPNRWCRSLYAAMLDWGQTFTERNASAEMEYLAAMQLADEWRERRNNWFDELTRARKARGAAKREASERAYWESRDVETMGT